MNALPRQDPAHMGPETAVLRRMWITFFVRVLVMHAMYRDEENWAALQSERATYGENVLHPFRRLIPSMHEESMVSHPNPDAAGDPPQKHRDQECFPGEYEQSCYSADVKDGHKEGRDPNEWLRKRSIVP